MDIIITDIDVKDIRFPASLTLEGSDAMNPKFEIPVCPHAGGVGLCEYVQHLSMIDYITISGTKENQIIEYVDHLHEHFLEPVVIKNGAYMPPT